MVNSPQKNKEKNIEAIYPLSPMQEGMLFHSLYDPGSSVYFEQFSLEIKGQLNINSFQQAWQKIVDRHPILRTIFIWENRKQPLQVVRKQVKLPWTFSDWQSFSLDEQKTKFDEFLKEDRQQGFDFKKAPLMRCRLIQITEQSYYFVWSHHHILCDGWCLPILFKEVLTFYEAYCQKQTCRLPKPRPYRDYIAWLQKQDLNKAETFWRNNLQGFTVPTSLMIESLVSSKTKLESSRQSQTQKLSKEFTENLNQFARKNRLTLNTIIQGVWGIILSRYSGESDVVFGATVSGRSPELTDVESMVGLFINTLPVRVKIPENATVIPWLQNLRTDQVEREQYSYTPLVQIKAWSEVSPERALFNSILVFENYPIDESLRSSASNIEINILRVFEQTNYPLSLLVSINKGLEIKTFYDPSYFSDESIEFLSGNLVTLLESIITNPEEKVTKLPLLTEREEHKMLVEWNNTAAEYPKDKCIHELFEEQVERTPDAVAVVYEEEQLTYEELNQKANQLANYLQKLGVKPDTLVGICVERSVEMIIGLLGILKAGGAYVPIDPNYPQERIEYMLDDSKVSVLLTQEKLLEELLTSQAQTICLDRDWVEIDNEGKINPETLASSGNLAYVIYTSGSTGKPKGVLIEHQGLVNLILSAIREYQLTGKDKVLQFATISFDTAGEQIYGCLLSGGTLVLRTEEVVGGIDQFLQNCGNSNLTVLDLPTAYWQQITSELKTNNLGLPPSVRLVIIGGEGASPELVRTWQKYVSDSPQLINAYGPTETTVTATICQIDSATKIDKNVPIGKPIDNTKIYILDSNLQPVPIGVAGELHIGGDGLARGYLNRPELTTEKFIPNPFGEGKLYKTGDLCRYLPDGNIEYIGRIDHQVKIRGFRIELGEIEAQLSNHPEIRESVVIAREDEPGNKRLVAYVVSDVIPEQSVSQTLREYLKKQLPDYMIPSAFVFLEKLPLTPNGKIDRKSLPAPDWSQRTTSDEFVPPQSEIEITLAHIWQEVLRIEQVGINENFFELGGHSLLATQVISRIRAEFSLEIPLRLLFEQPTIATLAESIERNLLTTVIQDKQHSSVDDSDREELEI